MATSIRRSHPPHQSRAKLHHFYFITFIINTLNIASFQIGPPIPTFDYNTSLRTLINNDLTDDDSAITGCADANSCVFRANAIRGETLDVILHDGKYSWSNPNAIENDARSHIHQSSTVDASSPSSFTSKSYKRVHFPGCGSILIHQQPESFLEPNNPIDNDCTSAGKSKRRRKGRTGVTLWSASHVISNYIDKQWSKDGAWNNEDNSRWVVLELGAGLGLCSAVAAKHGMNVISTDNDPMVLSLLKENVKRNQSDMQYMPSTTNHQSKQQVNVHSLDWAAVASDPNAENSHPAFLQLESLSGVDLVILSDVIYGATQPLWDDLLVLLNKLRSQRQRLRVELGDPIVLLGYTQRRRDLTPQDEARFFAKMHAVGMEAVLIPSTHIPQGEKYMLTSMFELRWIVDAQ